MEQISKHRCRRALVAIGAAAALATVAACGSSSGDSTSGAKKVTIAYVPGVSNLGYFDTAARGAKEQAKKYGYTVDYVAVTAYDSSVQNAALNAELAKKPDFLLVSPVDEVAQQAAIARYHAAGIPVITVGGTLKDTSGIVSQILTDNFQGGELVADYLGEALGGKGTVVAVNLAKGQTTLEDRVDGFASRLAAKYPGITVLPEQYGGGAAADTQKFFRSYLLAHPEVDGVFGVAESAAEGASAAVRALGKRDSIKIAAFDAAPEQVKSLKVGDVQMLSVSKPGTQLALAIDQVHAYLTGDKGSIAASTKVPNITVTAENVDSPSIAPFLYQVGK